MATPMENGKIMEQFKHKIGLAEMLKGGGYLH